MSRHDPMMIKSILFAAVLLTCFPRGQSSNPHDEPKNTAVKLGDDAILRCNIAGNASVIWDFYDVGKTRKDDSRLVSNRGVILEQFHGNYTLNRTLPGQNDLVIRSVQVEDAGIYECTRGLHSRPSAHLNVLSEPVCGVRDEKGVVMSVNRGGKIRLSCVFHQLAGHCKPVMEWSIDNGTFVSRTMLNDTKPESRRVVLESNFTVMELGVEKVIFTCAIIFTCPSNDYYFKNLSTIDPDYRYVCKSFEILVLDSTETEKYTVSTSIIQSHEAGPGGATHNIQSRVLFSVTVNWTAIFLGLLVVILIIGSIVRMILKHIDKTRTRNLARQPFPGAEDLSQPPEYFEINIPDSTYSAESAPVNPGRGLMARAAETDSNVGGTGIRLTEVSRVGAGNTNVLSTLQLSNKQTKSRPLTATLPNQGTNGKYVELDSTRRDRSAPAPSVYKRLNNKEQQLLQNSSVTHISPVEDEPHYCNVNRPRLPTPESNTSIESNMDQLAA